MPESELMFIGHESVQSKKAPNACECWAPVRARSAQLEKAPHCVRMLAARARCRPGRSRKMAILAPADRRRHHDERRARQHVGGGTGVDLEQLHDPAYWPTGLLA